MRSISARLGSAAPIAIAVLLSIAGAGPSAAQAIPRGMPAVPTTRVLAIGHLTAKATPAVMSGVMDAEVRATERLYLAGKIDQWFVRKDKPGVVFILETADPATARAMLDALPLGQAGLMDFDLIPLGPLAPLGLLLGK